MIKQIARLLTFFTAIGVFLFSCTGKLKHNEVALTFDSIKVEKTMHILGDTALPSCNIIVNYSFPVSKDSLLNDTLNYYLVQSCFGQEYVENNSYKTISPEDLVQQFVDKYIASYKNDVVPLYMEELKQQTKEEPLSMNWFNYYEEINGGVIFSNKDLIVYSNFASEYTGGAHGVYCTSYINFDMRLKRPLQLSDVFQDDYVEPVSNLIWMALMTKENVKTKNELEEMGYGSLGEIIPIENFYLTPDGITFHYNIYEIAPYAMGATSVTLPYSQLTRWLTNLPALQSLI